MQIVFYFFRKYMYMDCNRDNFLFTYHKTNYHKENDRNYMLNVGHLLSEKIFKRWLVPFKILMREYYFEFLRQMQARVFWVFFLKKGTLEQVVSSKFLWLFWKYLAPLHHIYWDKGKNQYSVINGHKWLFLQIILAGEKKLINMGLHPYPE